MGTGGLFRLFFGALTLHGHQKDGTSDSGKYNYGNLFYSYPCKVLRNILISGPWFFLGSYSVYRQHKSKRKKGPILFLTTKKEWKSNSILHYWFSAKPNFSLTAPSHPLQSASSWYIRHLYACTPIHRQLRNTKVFSFLTQATCEEQTRSRLDRRLPLKLVFFTLRSEILCKHQTWLIPRNHP